MSASQPSTDIGPSVVHRVPIESDAKLREKHAISMIQLGNEQETFLCKIKALCDEYAVVQPSVTIAYEVNSFLHAYSLRF